MSDWSAAEVLAAHGLPASLLREARRAGVPICIAVAAVDLSRVRGEVDVEGRLAELGQPDDVQRARASVWNQRLREHLPDECD